MSTRPRVLPGRKSFFFSAWRLLVPLIFCACLLLTSASHADEQIIITLTLNQQKKGDFFVILKDDGDFLIGTADLASAGLHGLPTEHIDVDGEPYLSLRTMAGIEYHFDETTLTLELNADPQLLPKSSLDLSPKRRSSIIYPRDTSLFLNYGIDYSAGGDDFVFEGLTVSNELGIRFRDLLFLSDTLYTESPDDTQFVRLNTNLTWDDRQTLRRGIAGDFFTFSGNLGSRVQVGGLSLSKVYRIDPYFIQYPLFDFSGMASLPSDVELYVDGMRVRSERFAPGEFELQNFQSIGGAQTIEVVVRDSFGREQRIAAPFYFTDQILRRGLHEYSYNLGLLRRDFGQESNSYSDLAFSAFHRYGLTDSLNLGLRGEAGDGLANLGVESVMKTGSVGLLRLEAAGSRDEDDSGAAGFLAYEYTNRRFRARLAVQSFSEGYRTLTDAGTLTTTSRRKLNLLAGIGYMTPQLGSFGLDFARSESYNGPERESLTFSWSRRLWKRVYANATLRQIRDTDTRHEAGINLTWYLGRDHSISGALRREGDATIQQLEARRNIPSGIGTGWNVRGERADQDGSRTDLLNAVAQHNARYASMRGDFSLGRSETASTEDLRLSLAGALVSVGDTVALTRPVRDSFALVSVGEVEGVAVAVNGQTSGRTDRRGKVVVPDLSSYYENQIAIEDKDIPIDFLMPRVRLNVSPPLRSGSCLNFPLQRYQAFTGFLSIDGGNGAEPLAYAELELETPSGSVTFWTGGDGEFYLDSQQVEFDMAAHQGCEALEKGAGAFLPAGVYPLSVKQEKNSFRTEIVIPEATEQFAELGQIVLPVLSTGTPASALPETMPAEDEVLRLPAPPPPTDETQPAPAPMADEPSPGPEATASEPAPLAAHAPAEPEIHANAGPPAWPTTTIHFPFDRATPIAADRPLLAELARFLLTHSAVKVAIEGHACRLGSETYNDRLGRRRAEAVRQYLLDAGIAPWRIERLDSFGERQPACPETAEDCLRRNRRAVVLLVKTQEN